MNRRLIVTGMHRSGTSLIGNWLHQMGLDLGENLIGATPSNLLGHYEDLEIVEFHEELLRYNGTSMYESSKQKMLYSKEHLEQAKKSIRDRDQKNFQWGWKQPRATLFLNLWCQTGIKIHYVFVIREPEIVVNSLLKREANKIIVANNNSKYLNAKILYNFAEKVAEYSRMYSRHLGEIIQFIKDCPDTNYEIINISSFLKQWNQYYSMLTEGWNFKLSHLNPSNIYDNGMIIKKNEYYNISAKVLGPSNAKYNYLKSLMT